MVEKLAKHERLALYNLTEREIDQLEEELVKQFPKEEFAETYIGMWQNYRDTNAIQIYNLVEAKYPGSHNDEKRARVWFEIATLFPHRMHELVRSLTGKWN
jgi:hypothetical protein